MAIEVFNRIEKKYLITEDVYGKFNLVVSSKLSDFSDKIIGGADFNKTMVNLRDDLINELNIPLILDF